METASQDRIRELVISKFPEEFIDTYLLDDIYTIQVHPGKIEQIIQFLYSEETLAYRFLTSLFAVHYPDSSEFELIYLLHNLHSNTRLRIKTRISDQQPQINTITTVFSGANWMERETYDFFGVQFKGHPDLRRILNVEDMIMFPMRKEFPLEDQTREDKNDLMFGR